MEIIYTYTVYLDSLFTKIVHSILIYNVFHPNCDGHPNNPYIYMFIHYDIFSFVCNNTQERDKEIPQKEED